MSSAGGNNNNTGSRTKSYFCYQCERTISVAVSLTSDPFCPLCNDGFLEECQNPNPIPDASPFPDPFSSLFPLLFSSVSSPTSGDLPNPNFFSNPSTATRTSARSFPEFDPLAFLQNHLENMRAEHGTHIEFVVDSDSEPGFRLPSNIGDYFMGPGLEQLIQQLAENDPNRYGTPPASKSAIETLPTIKVADEHLNSEMNQCAVCQDEFEKGMEVKQMPCKHLYHNDCIVPWLELHNSCPVCRFELPTDDEDYENRTRGNAGNASEGGSRGTSDENNRRVVERTLRINLPWPFGAFSGSSDSETSDGGRNSGTRDGWGF